VWKWGKTARDEGHEGARERVWTVQGTQRCVVANRNGQVSRDTERETSVGGRPQISARALPRVKTETSMSMRVGLGRMGGGEEGDML